MSSYSKEVIRDLAAGTLPWLQTKRIMSAYQDEDRFFKIISVYQDRVSWKERILLPVGEAWLRALGTDKRLRLYSDLTHPSSLGGDLAVLTIYLSLFPAGHQEFDEAFVANAARALEMPRDRRDLLFDAATRAIDEPMVLK